MCDDSWTFSDAMVVCRQLGFSTAISAPSYAAFGVGYPDQPIWLDEVKCQGTEVDLMACRHNPLAVHNCRHYEDASVICSEQGDTSRDRIISRLTP